MDALGQSILQHRQKTQLRRNARYSTMTLPGKINAHSNLR
eukprot:gene10-17_t